MNAILLLVSLVIPLNQLDKLKMLELLERSELYCHYASELSFNQTYIETKRVSSIKLLLTRNCHVNFRKLKIGNQHSESLFFHKYKIVTGRVESKRKTYANSVDDLLSLAKDLTFFCDYKTVVFLANLLLSIDSTSQEVIDLLANAYFNLAKLHMFEGHYEHVRTYMIKYFELTPSESQLYGYFAQFLYYDQKYEEAIEYSSKAIHLNSDNYLAKSIHSLASECKKRGTFYQLMQCPSKLQSFMYLFTI